MSSLKSSNAIFFRNIHNIDIFNVFQCFENFECCEISVSQKIVQVERRYSGSYSFSGKSKIMVHPLSLFLLQKFTFLSL